MRLLKLKHGSRVSGRSSGAVRPSVDSGAVFTEHQDSVNSLKYVSFVAGCVSVFFGLCPTAGVTGPLTFILNKETIEQLVKEDSIARSGVDLVKKTITWDAAYRMNDPAGSSGRPSILSGDTLIMGDEWTLVHYPEAFTKCAAIYLSPRILNGLYSSSILIKGEGTNKIKAQLKPGQFAIYTGIDIEPPNPNDVRDGMEKPSLEIRGVDLDFDGVVRGISQLYESTAVISSDSVKIQSSPLFSGGQKAIGDVAIQVWLQEGNSELFIDSSLIDLSAQDMVISQEVVSEDGKSATSIISLNSKNTGKVCFQTQSDNAPITFWLQGENARTRIGGEFVEFKTDGTPQIGIGERQDDTGNFVPVRAVSGAHTAYIQLDSELEIATKNVEGTILFITGSGGTLKYGSEPNQTKSSLRGGFEFSVDSGKNQVYFGPGSVFNGHIMDATASVDGAVPTFSMKESTWNVLTELAENPDHSSTVSSLKLENSTVDLTREKNTSLNATYGTVTLGKLDSTKGIFRLDVDIANKLNDKIIVKDKVTGKSFLSITSAGTGNGTDSEILVKAPVDTPEESFLLEPKEINGQKYRAIDEGARIYRLANVQNETEKDKRDWYLTPCKEGECLPVEEEPEPPEPTPDPPDPPKPGKPSPDNPGPALPVYSPSAEAIFAMAGMGSQTAFYQGQLSDLRERLGEIRRDVRGEVREGLWASIGAQKDRIAGFSSTSFKSTVYRFNFGYDTAVGEWLIGGNFKYASANQKTKDAFFKAKGDAHSEGLNAYAVWHNEKGCYADLILSADRYHQRLNTSMLDGAGVRGTYRNWGVGVSAEVGKKSFIDAQKTWFVEPQLQLAYYRIHGDNFTLSNGMKVKQGNFNSLTGRLGVALGRDIKSSEGQDKGQVYLRAGVKNEFLGKQKVYINDERFSDKLTGNRVYYGLATDWLVRKNIKVYGHIEREKGAHYTKEIEAQVGLKWQF